MFADLASHERRGAFVVGFALSIPLGLLVSGCTGLPGATISEEETREVLHDTGAEAVQFAVASGQPESRVAFMAIEAEERVVDGSGETWTLPGRRTIAAIDPVDRRIYFAYTTPAGGEAGLWSVDADGISIAGPYGRPLGGHLVLDPAGTITVFELDDEHLYRRTYDPITADVVAEQTHDERILVRAVSHRGDVLVGSVVTDEPGLAETRLEVIDGSDRRTFDYSDDLYIARVVSHAEIVIHPDGDHALLSSGAGWWRLDLVTGEITEIDPAFAGHGRLLDDLVWTPDGLYLLTRHDLVHVHDDVIDVVSHADLGRATPTRLIPIRDRAPGVGIREVDRYIGFGELTAGGGLDHVTRWSVDSARELAVHPDGDAVAFVEFPRDEFEPILRTLDASGAVSARPLAMGPYGMAWTSAGLLFGGYEGVHLVDPFGEDPPVSWMAGDQPVRVLPGRTADRVALVTQPGDLEGRAYAVTEIDVATRRVTAELTTTRQPIAVLPEADSPGSAFQVLIPDASGYVLVGARGGRVFPYPQLAGVSVRGFIPGARTLLGVRGAHVVSIEF